MNQVLSDLQVILVSLASDLNNRVWMESYIMCCSFLEQAAVTPISSNEWRRF
jgi:hypothetical protein